MYGSVVHKTNIWGGGNSVENSREGCTFCQSHSIKGKNIRAHLHAHCPCLRIAVIIVRQVRIVGNGVHG